MPLKDHKEEIRCVTDIATLLKWRAIQLEKGEDEQAKEVRLTQQFKRIEETSGLTWGSFS